MRVRLILTLILLYGLLIAGPAAAQMTEPPDELPPVPPSRAFVLAQAYPCFADVYSPDLGIADPACYNGLQTPEPLGPAAAPGVLCLARRGQELDANCFVSPPPLGGGPCFVQSYQLIKTVPGRASIIMIGKQVRTWWSLNFTPPGTTFTLTVTAVCRGRTDRRRIVFRETWLWRVDANPETMLRLVELMHTGAVGTLELPCILAEDGYDLLVQLVLRLDLAVTSLQSPPTPDQSAALQQAIIDLEQFLLLSCVTVEFADPVGLYPGPEQFGDAGYQPPGNLGTTVFVGEAATFAGILDTVEHPCCSILLADLDYISTRAGMPLFLRLPRLQ